MSRFLITGGSGFIGSHTVFTLLNAGYKITVLDSFINSFEKALISLKNLNYDNPINFDTNLEVVKGDIRDKNILNKIFIKAEDNEDSIQGVIHFAGLKSVSGSIKNPIEYWRVNVGGTVTLIEVMNDHNCNNLVFSSSATIYGSNNLQPLRESSLIKPSSPYGFTKAAVENFLTSLCLDSNSKWKIANLRYFNPIGSHPSGLIGEDPITPGGNLFPQLGKAAFNKKEILKIYGNDWPTYDGTGVRDFIHVLDLSDGHKAAIEYLLKNPPQVININLGTGLGTSVLDLIRTFEKVNNTKIPFIFSSKREGDIPISIADNKLALEILDWKPKRNLEDMCKDFWKWKTKNPSGYQNKIY